MTGACLRESDANRVSHSSLADALLLTMRTVGFCLQIPLLLRSTHSTIFKQAFSSIHPPPPTMLRLLASQARSAPTRPSLRPLAFTRMPLLPVIQRAQFSSRNDDRPSRGAPEPMRSVAVASQAESRTRLRDRTSTSNSALAAASTAAAPSEQPHFFNTLFVNRDNDRRRRIVKDDPKICRSITGTWRPQPVVSPQISLLQSSNPALLYLNGSHLLYHLDLKAYAMDPSHASVPGSVYARTVELAVDDIPLIVSRLCYELRNEPTQKGRDEVAHILETEAALARERGDHTINIRYIAATGTSAARGWEKEDAETAASPVAKATKAEAAAAKAAEAAELEAARDPQAAASSTSKPSFDTPPSTASASASRASSSSSSSASETSNTTEAEPDSTPPPPLSAHSVFLHWLRLQPEVVSSSTLVLGSGLNPAVVTNLQKLLGHGVGVQDLPKTEYLAKNRKVKDAPPPKELRCDACAAVKPVADFSAQERLAATKSKDKRTATCAVCAQKQQRLGATVMGSIAVGLGGLAWMLL